MQAKRIDHIVIAVPDLEAAVATYEENFGLTKVGDGEVPALGIRNAYLQIGKAQIELVTPLTEQGPVADFLAKQGGGMYLLSLEVDDLDQAIEELQEKGVRVNVAEGSAGQRLAFVSPRATHGVLLQLLER
ncbi:Ethylmalonyl-CoA/methylmalonyl-CoA epimerase [Candidatus Entotheonellaceae bacterium PAL068K]